MSDILVERAGAIATVVINRPQRRNAISYAMWGELARVTRGLGEDDTVRGIVYRGAGRQAFASGADIAEFGEHRKDTETVPALRRADGGRLPGHPTLREADGGHDPRLLHGRGHGHRHGL